MAGVPILLQFKILLFLTFDSTLSFVVRSTNIWFDDSWTYIPIFYFTDPLLDTLRTVSQYLRYVLTTYVSIKLIINVRDNTFLLVVYVNFPPLT